MKILRFLWDTALACDGLGIKVASSENPHPKPTAASVRYCDIDRPAVTARHAKFKPTPGWHREPSPPVRFVHLVRNLRKGEGCPWVPHLAWHDDLSPLHARAFDSEVSVPIKTVCLSVRPYTLVTCPMFLLNTYTFLKAGV